MAAHVRRTSLFLLFFVSLTTFAGAQAKKPRPQQAKKEVQAQKASETPQGKPEQPPDPMSTATFNGLKLRLIGPAILSGRVVSIAVNPKNRSEYYIGAASGGVWKTTNNGVTYTPVFDSQGSYSIGHIAIDPNDPNVVWVGTGENNSQRSVAYGDGVYKSVDGGKNWENVGLKKSEHIGRIVIDARNSNTVYVAAEGPLWGPGGDRGIYRTKDGGKTWDRVLFVSDNTGFADLAMDPENPDILYAAAYQRRRHVWTLIDGGPESAIYKSTDAGTSWVKLKNGLPTVDMGRIGVAVSPVDPNVVYASIEAADEKGGIFRSKDKGATWEKRNSFDQGAMYYAQIFTDPRNVDRIYVGNVFLKVSDDGGKTLRNLGEKSKHVDNHVIWIDPADNNHYLIGCDGGVYESYDRGENWNFKANLPLGQFYDIAVDNSLPFYNVYGGTQDNSTWGGPSRTKSASGISNRDWEFIHGGDGFRSQVDPEDPSIVYAEYQYGNLVRFDRRSGESVGIVPPEPKGGPPYRFNWDSPLLISPHNHTRIYFAANVLFRSDDRGDNWQVISPDLTRQIDRNQLPVMGKVWGPDAVAKNQSTSFYGNIVALSESPKKEGVIYVGTDDGLIQVTEDGGKNWTKRETFAGVPDRTYVSRLLASQHDGSTVYAAFENHKNADFKPYLLKSTDAGRSWTSIAGNLPENGPVLAIAEDPLDPNLLFVGTEFGLWFSIDAGKKWVQLKGGSFPVIAVRDLAIQKREGDLVVGTFGRGIYVLDDLTPLRQLKPEQLQQQFVVYPVKDALMYIQERPLGGRGKSWQGESFYTAANPPYGAVFTYYQKEKNKTQKELRQDAEKKAEKAGQPVPYPSNGQLRSEAEEQAPEVFAIVYDETGRPVRRINGVNGAGLQRIAWDLRYPAPTVGGEPSEFDEDFPPLRNMGPLVMPGKYSARMYKKVHGETTEIGAAQTFNVAVEGQGGISNQDRAALRDFQRKVTDLYRAVSGSIKTAQEVQTRLKAINSALHETPAADANLSRLADQLTERNNLLLRQLRGDVVLAARNENVPASINDRVMDIMEGERFAIAKPTGTHLMQYELASQEYAQALAQQQKLVEGDLANLQKQMEVAGAPWTPGRVPAWHQQ